MTRALGFDARGALIREQIVRFAVVLVH